MYSHAPDLPATFNHLSQAGTVAWKGSQDCIPEELHNGTLEYLVAAKIQWIMNGWLVPYLEES